MRIKTFCPHCGKKLGGPPQLRGKQVKCSRCGEGFTVPENLEPVPDAPKPAATAQGAPATAQEPEPEDELVLVGSGPQGPAQPTAAAGLPPGQAPGPRPRASGPLPGGAALKYVAILAALGAAGYVGWTYTQGGGAAAPGAPEKKPPRPSDSDGEDLEDLKTVAKKSAPPSGRGAPSLLVVSNTRYPAVLVFTNVKLGEVARGTTEAFPISGSAGETRISFEVRGLPKGVSLSKDQAKAVEQGVPFRGDESTGLKIEFEGPPAEILPAAEEILQSITLQGIETDARSGNAAIVSFLYKGQTLRAPGKGGKLQLSATQEGGKQVLKWIPQDCVVEKDGQTVYAPPEEPFKTGPVKLIKKDGKLAAAE
ncbi:MAG: hypothetical protein M5U26_25025 [Planctomycetota bacterium]|nr:hypothetical protein [Planctomycetota bacterium]